MSSSEVTKTEVDYDGHVILMQEKQLKELGGLKQADDPELDLYEDDPENWDVFRDAHKFEILNRHE